MKTRIFALGLLLLLVSAGISWELGYSRAEHQWQNSFAKTLLSQSGVLIKVLQADSVHSAESRYALQDQVLLNIGLVVATKPDISQLDGSATEGLCLVRAALANDLVGLRQRNKKMADFFDAYIRSTEQALAERLEQFGNIGPVACVS